MANNVSDEENMNNEGATDRKLLKIKDVQPVTNVVTTPRKTIRKIDMRTITPEQASVIFNADDAFNNSGSFNIKDDHRRTPSALLQRNRRQSNDYLEGGESEYNSHIGKLLSHPKPEVEKELRSRQDTLLKDSSRIVRLQ